MHNWIIEEFGWHWDRIGGFGHIVCWGEETLNCSMMMQGPLSASVCWKTFLVHWTYCSHYKRLILFYQQQWPISLAALNGACNPSWVLHNMFSPQTCSVSASVQWSDVFVSTWKACYTYFLHVISHLVGSNSYRYKLFVDYKICKCFTLKFYFCNTPDTISLWSPLWEVVVVSDQSCIQLGVSDQLQNTAWFSVLPGFARKIIIVIDINLPTCQLHELFSICGSFSTVANTWDSFITLAQHLGGDI